MHGMPPAHSVNGPPCWLTRHPARSSVTKTDDKRRGTNAIRGREPWRYSRTLVGIKFRDRKTSLDSELRLAAPTPFLGAGPARKPPRDARGRTPLKSFRPRGLDRASSQTQKKLNTGEIAASPPRPGPRIAYRATSTWATPALGRRVVMRVDGHRENES